MKKVILILIAAMTLLMCGCEMNRVEGSGDDCIKFYVDPETNVEYVLYINGYAGGVCPRYNANGSLYVKGEDE